MQKKLVEMRENLKMNNVQIKKDSYMLKNIKINNFQAKYADETGDS